MNEEAANAAGFDHLGYAVICTNCERRHRLPAASTIREALADARRRGLLVGEEDGDFCNADCAAEHRGEKCLCYYARSGPEMGICPKCGEKSQARIDWERDNPGKLHP